MGREGAEATLEALRVVEDAASADDLDSLARPWTEPEASRADPEEDRWAGWCAVSGAQRDAYAYA